MAMTRTTTLAVRTRDNPPERSMKMTTTTQWPWREWRIIFAKGIMTDARQRSKPPVTMTVETRDKKRFFFKQRSTGYAGGCFCDAMAASNDGYNGRHKTDVWWYSVALCVRVFVDATWFCCRIESCLQLLYWRPTRLSSERQIEVGRGTDARHDPYCGVNACHIYTWKYFVYI